MFTQNSLDQHTPVGLPSGSRRVRLGLPATAGIARWIVLNFGQRFGPL
jgi:hypothetical protein